MCRRCKTKPHTGVFVELCDLCFDWWEAEVDEGRGHGQVLEFIPQLAGDRRQAN